MTPTRSKKAQKKILKWKLCKIIKSAQDYEMHKNYTTLSCNNILILIVTQKLVVINFLEFPSFIG